MNFVLVSKKYMYLTVPYGYWLIFLDVLGLLNWPALLFRTLHAYWLHYLCFLQFFIHFLERTISDCMPRSKHLYKCQKLFCIYFVFMSLYCFCCLYQRGQSLNHVIVVLCIMLLYRYFPQITSNLFLVHFKNFKINDKNDRKKCSKNKKQDIQLLLVCSLKKN